MKATAKYVVHYWKCPWPCAALHERSNRRCGNCGTARPKWPKKPTREDRT